MWTVYCSLHFTYVGDYRGFALPPGKGVHLLVFHIVTFSLQKNKNSAVIFFCLVSVFFKTILQSTTVRKLIHFYRLKYQNLAFSSFKSKSRTIYNCNIQLPGIFIHTLCPHTYQLPTHSIPWIQGIVSRSQTLFRALELEVLQQFSCLH